MRTGIGLLMLLGLLLLLPSLCSAATIYVDCNVSGGNDDGSSWANAYDTIAEALTDAGYGDEIWVAAGTYVENLTMGAGDELYGGFAGTETTFGERDYEANETIIDGDASGSCVVMAADTIIDGFTITNGDVTNGGGVNCDYSSATISNNTITGNTATYGGGIYCGGGDSPTIANNAITDNSVTGLGGAIYCEDSSSPSITGNVITGNTANGYGGAIRRVTLRMQIRSRSGLSLWRCICGADAVGSADALHTPDRTSLVPSPWSAAADPAGREADVWYSRPAPSRDRAPRFAHYTTP